MPTPAYLQRIEAKVERTWWPDEAEPDVLRAPKPMLLAAPCRCASLSF